MLLRSLAAGLYKNGKRIVAKEAGYIYVVRSLSEHPKIAPLQNLYKIGYSTTPVEKRLRNTEKSSTYLYAAVELVAKFTCYNIDPTEIRIFIAQVFFQLLFGCANKRRHASRMVHRAVTCDTRSN